MQTWLDAATIRLLLDGFLLTLALAAATCPLNASCCYRRSKKTDETK